MAVVILYHFLLGTYKILGLVNETNLAHTLFLVYLSISTFHVTVCPSSGETTLFFTTLGTCYSVWMTVWYAGWNPPSIPDSHPHRINIYLLSCDRMTGSYICLR